MSTRTGVPAVDRFLDLWFANDSAAIAAEAVFRERPCSRVFGSVPCEDGMAEGTLRPAFSFTSCSPRYLFSADELVQALGPQPASGFSYLVAVYEMPGEPAALGYYVVALGTPAYARAFYVDREGHLTGSTGCGSGWPPPAGARIILAPRDQ